MHATRPITTRLALVGLLLCAGSAMSAQPERPPLRGPTVAETGVPGVQRSFTMEDGMRGPQARMLNREIPMAEFMSAVRALGGPDAPPGLALTPAQRDTLAQIARGQAQALRGHLAAHREELTRHARTLGVEPELLIDADRPAADRLPLPDRRPDAAPRLERRAARGDAAQADPSPRPAAGQPGADRPARTPEQAIRERIGDTPTPAQREALQRLREIRASGPGTLETQTRAWNALNPDQQRFVQERLGEARARQERARGEMAVREPAARGQDPAAAPRPARPASPDAAAARLHRLIDELSPQEQDALLAMIEARLQQRRGVQGGPPGTRPDPARRPSPPPMERINVPSPTDPL